jgi:outer membrane protein assembly factor BamB
MIPRLRVRAWCVAAVAIAGSFSVAADQAAVRPTSAPHTSAPATSPAAPANATSPFPRTVDWPGWGGPAGNFVVAAPGLRWQGSAPRQAWRRDLGDGYSTVVGDAAAIYTMARKDDRTLSVLALDPATGAPRWTRDLEDTVTPQMFTDYGKGPNSTPLLAGRRLFVVTPQGRLCALDAATGRTIWTRELWKELRGTFRDVGYSASPLLVDGRIVLPVGGRGQALVAFDADTGATAWQSGDYGNAMASPLLIDLDGERQIVMFLVEGVAGFEATTGAPRWFSPHKTDFDVNAATPVWHAASRTIVISSAYGNGARGIRLTRQGTTTTAREVWHNRRLRVHHGNMLVLGNHVYGSSGDFGPAPLTAVDVETGALAWQDRRFPKVTMVHLGDRTMLLDEDGRLAIATLAPGGLTVHQEASVTTKLSWSAPTLIGNRVYVRDRRTLVALDLDRP